MKSRSEIDDVEEKSSRAERLLERVDTILRPSASNKKKFNWWMKILLSLILIVGFAYLAAVIQFGIQWVEF